MRELQNPLGSLSQAGEVALKVLRDLPGTSVFVFDRDLRVVMSTGPAALRLGYRPEEVEGRLLVEIFPARAFATLAPQYRAALGGSTSLFPYEASDGRHFEIETTPLRDDSGEIVAGVSISRDITEGHEAFRARYEAEALFESAFVHAPIGMALVSPDGVPQRVNRALCAITGHSAERILSGPLEELTHPDDRAESAELGRRCLAGELDSYVVEKRYVTAAGEHVWARLSVSLVRDEEGEPRHFVAQVEDISERRRGEAELKHRAEHDALTGLKNRSSFEAALVDLLAGDGAAGRGEPATLILIDLDDFKRLNDTRGHLAGDRFLRHVAETISASVRDGDVVARFGGDEFAILLPGAGEAAARDIAHGLLETLRRSPLVLDGMRTHVTASIGVVPLAGEGLDPEGAMRNVDRALYEAKARGRNQVTWRAD